MGRGKPTAYDGLVKMVSGEPRWTGKVVLDAGKLAQPLRWRKSRRIFVNSMSDLFHESLTNEQIAAVFGVMAACPQHTFQVLTKRAKRMREWFEWIGAQPSESGPAWNGAALTCARRAFDFLEWDERLNRADDHKIWPLSNAWIGVSVENQDAADERIPDLLATPAAVRFMSCEPLIGSVDLRMPRGELEHGGPDAELRCSRCGLEWPMIAETEERHVCPPGFGASIDWIIAGCESGPGARPCDVAWLRSLRDQCATADVQFFLKQAHPWVWVNGARAPGHSDDGNGAIAAGPGSRRKPGGVVELPYLDGVQHAAFPRSEHR